MIAILTLVLAGIGIQGDFNPSADSCSADASERRKSHRRALIIGIDGLTGAAFWKRAFVDDAAPVLKALALRGRYTVCESNQDERCALAHDGPNRDETFKWRTASGWLSVITGVDSTKHRVASIKPIYSYNARPRPGRVRNRYRLAQWFLRDVFSSPLGQSIHQPR